jgi:hypothetical protein
MDPERAEVDAAIEAVGTEADGAGDGDGKEDDLSLETGADEATGNFNFSRHMLLRLNSPAQGK